MSDFTGALATLDIIILVIVLLSALIGLYRGLVKELLSLLSWVLAFVLAIYFSTQAAHYLPASWGAQTLRVVLAFVLIFIATLIAASMLQWLLAQLVAGTGLSGTDRFLGFLFGSARGLLVCIVVLIGVREVAAETSWWQASQLQGELLAFESEVRDLLGRAKSMAEQVPLPPDMPPDMPEDLLPLPGS